jgi:AcrR family transcriptional regulator
VRGKIGGIDGTRSDLAYTQVCLLEYTDLCVYLLHMAATDDGAGAAGGPRPPLDRDLRAALPARERILETAYELFSRHGVRAVGVDRIIDESGVAKKTLYRHFPAKADLIVAFLDLRRQRWTYEWLREELRAGGRTPRRQLLAVFSALDTWFHMDEFESCSFVRTLLEIPDAGDRVHTEAADQLEVVREVLREPAEQAGLRDPEAIAYQLQTLMLGAIVSATRGDLLAARRARELVELLLVKAR